MRKFSLIILTTLAAAAGFAGTKDEMVADAVRKIGPTLTGIPAEIRRVAVSTIEVGSNSGIDTASVQDQIGQVVLDSGRFQLIDRKSLKTLLDEQKLSLTGLVDPASMAKAGKIIGVQGFFFGSMETSADRTILNLKLVDADSGAIAYARKFTGVPQSFLCLGIGLAFTPAVAVLTNGNAVSVPAFGGQITYKQGFQGIPFGYVGLDLVLTKTFSDTVDIKRADIKPKVYFSPKWLFGWELDYVAPYAGVDFAMLLWGPVMEPSAFGIYPVFGLEVNLVRFLSVYVEGVYVFETALERNSRANLLTAGLALNIGATFNWYIY